MLNGDKNTTFFHQTTLSKRSRNKVVRLREGDGAWIEEEQGIIHELHSFYTNLFTSGRVSREEELTFDDTLKGITTQIPPNVNDDLV